MKSQHDQDRRDRAEDILSQNGYGKIKHLADQEVRKGIAEHEKHEHGGKKTSLKLASGGCAIGGKPADRLDRKPRAAGGRNKHKESKVSVNVINAGGKQPMPVPVPAGAGAPMPPRPPVPMPAPAAPMGGAPAGGGMPVPRAPMGGMPMQGRPFNKGGPVKNRGEGLHMEAGAGSGLGRLEKESFEQKRKKFA